MVNNNSHLRQDRVALIVFRTGIMIRPRTGAAPSNLHHRAAD
jgi:hypothetical protein